MNLGVEALTACRAHIAQAYGDRYVPEKPCVYQSKANAQEAHEAIRPTDVRTAPAEEKGSYPPGAQLCSKCSTKAMVMMDGCMTCLSCGDSKCG